MDVLIVTGMSGAGKSQAIKALEDIDYYCVDNVPPALLPKFAELSTRSGGGIDRMALVVDTRSQGILDKLLGAIAELVQQEYQVKILFLECDSTVLTSRYKETRRRHPLVEKGSITSVAAAIEQERELLQKIRSHADYLVDTSMLSANQLRDHIRHQFLNTDTGPMSATVMSFGFKYASPQEPDLLFDVRCLRNPYYVVELRPLTGLDAPVEEYIFQFEEAETLLAKIKDLLAFTLPLYIKEGKTNLVVAFGCTGGKHRSVAFAKRTADFLTEHNIEVTTLHRDIDRS